MAPPFFNGVFSRCTRLLFPLFLGDLKTFDIQTICAIIWANWAVWGMARFLSFLDGQIALNFCLDYPFT
jgi:hypothetical protein